MIYMIVLIGEQKISLKNALVVCMLNNHVQHHILSSGIFAVLFPTVSDTNS